jgi:hypothetical protein
MLPCSHDFHSRSVRLRRPLWTILGVADSSQIAPFWSNSAHLPHTLDCKPCRGRDGLALAPKGQGQLIPILQDWQKRNAAPRYGISPPVVRQPSGGAIIKTRKDGRLSRKIRQSRHNRTLHRNASEQITSSRLNFLASLAQPTQL